MTTCIVDVHPRRVGDIYSRIGECDGQDYRLIHCVVDFMFPQIARSYDLVGFNIVELGLEVRELNRNVRA